MRSHCRAVPAAPPPTPSSDCLHRNWGDGRHRRHGPAGGSSIRPRRCAGKKGAGACTHTYHISHVHMHTHTHACITLHARAHTRDPQPLQRKRTLHQTCTRRACTRRSCTLHQACTRRACTEHARCLRYTAGHTPGLCGVWACGARTKKPPRGQSRQGTCVHACTHVHVCPIPEHMSMCLCLCVCV